MKCAAINTSIVLIFLSVNVIVYCNLNHEPKYDYMRKVSSYSGESKGRKKQRSFLLRCIFLYMFPQYISKMIVYNQSKIFNSTLINVDFSII